MSKHDGEQRQPNRKYTNDNVSIEKTERVKLSPLDFPTSDGDLGILRIKGSDIPRQTRAPSRTTNGMTNSVSDNSTMSKIIKMAGKMV